MSRSDSTRRRVATKEERHWDKGVCPISRKGSYPTRKRALTALNMIRSEEGRATYPTAVYHCACGDWHLTSKGWL